MSIRFHHFNHIQCMQNHGKHCHKTKSTQNQHNSIFSFHDNNKVSQTMASINNQVLVPGAAGNAGNAGNAVAFGPPTFQATIVGWVATLFTLFTTLWVQNHATVAAANQATQSFLGGFQALGQQLCFVRLTVVLLHGMTADHIKQAVVSTMVRFRDHHHQGLGEALRIFFLEANPVALKIFSFPASVSSSGCPTALWQWLWKVSFNHLVRSRMPSKLFLMRSTTFAIRRSPRRRRKNARSTPSSYQTRLMIVSTTLLLEAMRNLLKRFTVAPVLLSRPARNARPWRRPRMIRPALSLLRRLPKTRPKKQTLEILRWFSKLWWNGRNA